MEYESVAKMTALERAALKRKPVKKCYGYGIIGKSGTPWWHEACVCQDREPIAAHVKALNGIWWAADPVERPYRVVRLFYETRKR